MRPVVASFIDTEGFVRDRGVALEAVDRAREAIVRLAIWPEALERMGIMVDVLAAATIALKLN
jgi:hypothetical protein